MAICLFSCAGYPRIQSLGTHPKCWWLQDVWVIWGVRCEHQKWTSQIQPAELLGNRTSPCEALAPPHPQHGQTLLPLGNVQTDRNPAGVREGRGWGCKNMDKKMRRRRSWFFLTSSTGWPVSLSSKERWSFLSAPCKFLVRCTQRGCPRLWWMEGWTWMDVRTQAETQLLLSSSTSPLFLHKYSCPITHHFLQPWQLMRKGLGLRVFI